MRVFIKDESIHYKQNETLLLTKCKASPVGK